MSGMPTLHKPIHGASWMILAGVAFAGVNALTPYLSQLASMPSTQIAFYQYLFAFILYCPVLISMGIMRSLASAHVKWHVLRVALAVLGVQFWIKALSLNIPIGQGVALLMTSPLFTTLGAGVLLKENLSPARLLATLLGFVGALVILQPWSDQFEWTLLLPLIAAFFWACHSLMVKYLSQYDSPTTMVMYLFILMLPFNLLLVVINTPWQQMSQLVDGFVLSQSSLFLLLIIALLTLVAQFAIAKAYNAADAAFVQPFDYVKLPVNVLLGWWLFGWAPTGWLLIGAILIIAASAYVTYTERSQSRQ